MGFPGEQLIIRIVDLFDKGVSAGLRPRQTIREARARAEARRLELLDAAQAMNDAEDIRTRRKLLSNDGKLLELSPPGKISNQPAEELPSLAQIARSDEVAEQMRKLANLKAIGVYAEEEAERITEEGMDHGGSVDPDWFAHWRRLAEQVSQEQGRRLWARVIAGEAKNPGTYNHRTLEFLATMTARDASLIEKLADFRVGDGVLYFHFHHIYETAGLNLSDLLHLENIGVITNVGNSLGPHHNCYSTKFGDKFYTAVANNGTALVLSSSDKKDFSLPAAIFTELGRELMSFVSPSPNPELLNAIARKAIELGFEVLEIGTVAPSGEVVNLKPFTATP